MRGWTREVLVWLLGVCVGAAMAFLVHRAWWYGLVADMESALVHPAFIELNPVMEPAPYAIAGLVAGVILGSGRPGMSSRLFRASGLVVLGAVLFTRDATLAASVYAPVATIAFVLAAAVVAALKWRVPDHADV